MERYWCGAARDPASPIWELVLDGRAWVFGADVRQRAYERVKREWPESLTFLEWARLGAWLDSDLGLSTALSIARDDGVFVEYAMDVRDAENPEFLKRLGAFDGPVNHADLREEADLRMLDLRSRGFRLPACTPPSSAPRE